MGGVSDSEGFSRPSSIAGFGASEGEAAAPVPLPGLPCIGGSSAPSAKKSSTRIPTVVPGHVFMHCSVKTVEMCTHAAARPLQRKSRTHTKDTCPDGKIVPACLLAGVVRLDRSCSGLRV